MKGLHTHSVAPNHRAPITMTFVAGLGVLLIAGTGVPSVALAQDNPALGTTTQPAKPQGGIPKRRWDTVNRARRTCRRASCAMKAARAVVSTWTGSWTRSCRFAKDARERWGSNRHNVRFARG